jgi:hypothetical protein
MKADKSRIDGSDARRKARKERNLNGDKIDPRQDLRAMNGINRWQQKSPITTRKRREMLDRLSTPKHVAEYLAHALERDNSELRRAVMDVVAALWNWKL